MPGVFGARSDLVTTSLVDQFHIVAFKLRPSYFSKSLLFIRNFILRSQNWGIHVKIKGVYLKMIGCA